MRSTNGSKRCFPGMRFNVFTVGIHRSFIYIRKTSIISQIKDKHNKSSPIHQIPSHQLSSHLLYYRPHQLHFHQSSPSPALVDLPALLNYSKWPVTQKGLGFRKLSKLGWSMEKVCLFSVSNTQKRGKIQLIHILS
jgi:hypothetical protein